MASDTTRFLTSGNRLLLNLSDAIADPMTSSRQASMPNTYRYPGDANAPSLN